MLTLTFLTMAFAQPEILGPGDHTRTLMMGEQKRTYLVHVPKGYDPKKTSDEAGFIVVYPSGMNLMWNAGGFTGKMAKGKTDDVAFIGKLLDDLATVGKVDEKRVYACGISNGGMMCYRFAAELSDRIAAIAPVAGTIAIDESKPKRPVPVIHFHGTKDTFVPFEMKKGKIRLKGVDDSVQTWVKLNGCEEKPKTDVLSRDGDELK